MVVTTSERALIDRPLPCLRKLLEFADRDFMARDKEGRHVHGMFRTLVVERHRIASTIGAHHERTGGNFDEIRGLGLGAWGLRGGLRLGAWGLRGGLRLGAWGLGKNTCHYKRDNCAT